MMFCGACSLNFTVIVLCRGHKRIYDIQPLKVKREGGHCSFSEPASWPWPSVKVNTVPITFKTAVLRSCKGFQRENGQASLSSMILVASWSEVKNSKCLEQHLSSGSLKEIGKSALICFLGALFCSWGIKSTISSVGINSKQSASFWENSSVKLGRYLSCKSGTLWVLCMTTVLFPVLFFVLQRLL